MKVRSIINTQIEFIEELPEEDYKMFNNNSNKSKAKSIMEETLKSKLNAEKIIVKSYRLEKENEKSSEI